MTDDQLTPDRLAELTETCVERMPVRLVTDHQQGELRDNGDNVIAEWGYAYRSSEVPQIVEEDFGWLRNALNALPALLAQHEQDQERIAELERERDYYQMMESPEWEESRYREKRLLEENAQLKTLLEQALAGEKVKPSPDEEL